MPVSGLTPRSVAIVDDDPAIRLALTRLVGSLGYAPMPFETGGHLLAALGAVEPGCVVTDLQMPGLSGLDLLRQLRLRRPRLRVILVTAYPSDANRRRALAYGAFAYLAKPFEAEELERCLARVFDTP
ncbi:response regulator [Methylobacterium sp. 17Sr1-1]|uniref:response regulator n=1 Tax=Methylobacterium sp. 17Sr1-1 TaxID=2202826 RepID=UPI000D6F9BBA|nr:response regulator [Methylobacterium sp. 17Sr1-1]AWN51144.1 two-component system response regulator [Methylobacterium sp. 17Sr1-1]